MSTNTGTGATAAAAASAGGDAGFDGCVPKSVTTVKVMDKARVDAIWEKLYASCAPRASNEKDRKALRCGAYVYVARNGTSPEGEYSGDIRTATGGVLLASAIAEHATRLDIRRFFRGNAKESIQFFRQTGYLQTDPVIRGRCEMMGIRVNDALALCDWVEGEVGLTPTEVALIAALKNHGVGRARAARGGKSVEELRADVRHEEVAAQSDRVLPPQAGGGW